MSVKAGLFKVPCYFHTVLESFLMIVWCVVISCQYYTVQSSAFHNMIISAYYNIDRWISKIYKQSKIQLITISYNNDTNESIKYIHTYVLGNFFFSGNFYLPFVIMDVFLCFTLITIHYNKRKLKIT